MNQLIKTGGPAFGGLYSEHGDTQKEKETLQVCRHRNLTASFY